MQHLAPDDATAHVLEPVGDVLEKGLRLLPAGPPLGVRLSDGLVDAPYALDGDTLLLSHHLAGPGLHHPAEPAGPVPPLDRWRRAAASVLEACAIRELERRCERTADLGDWRWMGAAIYAADAVAPSLSLALPDLGVAVATGDLGASPRAGVAAYMAWRLSGTDPVNQAQYLIEGGVVSPQEWLKLGGWVFDPVGAPARLPVPVSPPPRADVPAMLPPWSWRPVRVAAHPRGYQIVVDGSGQALNSWALGGAEHLTLAGATDGSCFLELDPGGPIGTWEVASAEAFGQIVGARGISFTFHPDGRLTLLLVDAVVGPLAAVAMAEELATSGVSEGRWRVAGPHQLGFADLRAAALPMQGRHRLGSGQAFGLAPWIQALEEGPWVWRIMPDRLVLRGSMRGGTVEVRLRPA